MKSFIEIGDLVEQEIGNLSYPNTPESLYDPIEYIMGLQAKRLRPILALMAYQLFEENIVNALPSAIAIELFHNFTLLHDDIMDDAPLRRGNPTVHKKWNSNVAILSGDVMMIKAYQLLTKVEPTSLTAVLNSFNKAAIKVCEGQQFDMDFENRDDVSLDEYMRMIEYKTAVLLAASLQIGAINARATKDEQDNLYGFGINIGIAFQLKDDFLDVFGTSESFGKQIGGDIAANKKTFLYLKALQLADHKTKKKLVLYYTNQDKSTEKVNEVRTIFKSLDIQKYLIATMQTHYKKAMQHLNLINSDFKDPLIAFSNKLLDRIS